MRQDVVDILRSFEDEGKVLFSRLDEFTWVLVPTRTGSAVVIVDLGDSITMRTGIGISVSMDYEFETSREALPEILAALQDGTATEYFIETEEGQLTPHGYFVEHPGGSLRQRSPDGVRRYEARLPVWNA